MSEKYRYQVDEKSLTQNFLLLFLWNPIVKWVPARITPNSITVCGWVCMVVSAFFIWAALGGNKWGYLGAAAFVFLYMTADNVDGAHARRTGQSSRLGEFLDHWLDSLNMVVINMSVILCLGFHDWLLVIVTLWMSIAFFATIWEHHHTGIFHSGRLGTNEGLLMVIGLDVLLFAAPANWGWISYHGPTHPTLALAFAYLTIAVCLVTVVKTAARVRSKFGDYLPFLLVIAAIFILGLKGMDKRLVAMGILLVNTLFAGPFLLGRLVGAHSNFRKWAVPVIAIAIIGTGVMTAYLETAVNTACWLYGAGIAMSLPIVWDISRAVYYLRPVKKQ